ncbi:MAG: HtrA protease/chaperone protein, partial [Myxococcaceae bacterium]|nr:HtrA protease/chaperone protein [Myxococcaceae bacterium]
GQVVGINTAISASGRGLGFAIPSDALKEILPQLLATGRVARGRLGALIQEVDAPLAKALGLDRPKGALVEELEPGGPAEKAGVRQGDVILSVNGTEIAHAHDLPRVVARNAPGARVTLQIVRDKTPLTFQATLAELKDEPSSDGQPGASPKGPAPELGLELTDAPGGGALVNRVLAGSVADGSLARGDIILEINRAPVGRGADATQKLRAATTTGGPLLFKIRRNGGTRFVAIDRR